MKKQKKHIEINTVLYTANIDIEIVNLITILNKLNGIKTTFCCQGNKTKRKNTPYFGMFCNDIDSLNLIKSILYTTSLETQSNIEFNTTTTYSQGIISTVYYVHFDKKSDILHFQKLLSDRIEIRKIQVETS